MIFKIIFINIKGKDEKFNEMRNQLFGNQEIHASELIMDIEEDLYDEYDRNLEADL